MNQPFRATVLFLISDEGSSNVTRAGRWVAILASAPNRTEDEPVPSPDPSGLLPASSQNSNSSLEGIRAGSNSQLDPLDICRIRTHAARASKTPSTTDPGDQGPRRHAQWPRLGCEHEGDRDRDHPRSEYRRFTSAAGHHSRSSFCSLRVRTLVPSTTSLSEASGGCRANLSNRSEY